jgi:hypothetical protein
MQSSEIIFAGLLKNPDGAARGGEITQAHPTSTQQDEATGDSMTRPRNITESHEIGLILSASPEGARLSPTTSADVNTLNCF